MCVGKRKGRSMVEAVGLQWSNYLGRYASGRYESLSPHWKGMEVGRCRMWVVH